MANWHVRVGASGSNNGTSWTNAWTALTGHSASYNAGDTIYIATGSYGSLDVGKSGTSGNPITFKRATIAEHGSATGWSDAYDGQVIISGSGSSVINIDEYDYLTFDGVSRTGIRSGHGIVIHGSATYGFRGTGNTGMTFRYLEIGGTGSNHFEEDGIQGTGDNFLAEYCWFRENDDPGTHGDGIQWYSAEGMIVRYCVFENCGQVMMITETVWGDDYINDLQFYCNVIYNHSGDHYNGISKKLCPQTGRYWHIYNNTWYSDCDTSTNWMDDVLGGADTCSRMEFRNNAFAKTRLNQMSGTTHTNNGYVTSGSHAVYTDTTAGQTPTETGKVTGSDLGFIDIGGADTDTPDFRIKNTSTLVGAGTNVSLSVDILGSPMTNPPPIGAYALLPAPGNPRTE